VINIAGLIPEGTKNLTWQWDSSFGNAVLRVSSEQNPQLYSSYLTDGKMSDQVAIGIDCSDPKDASKVGGCAPKVTHWQAFKNYLQVGFVHIVPKGLDHILFVVGLFLLSTHLRPLLIQVTSFTLAHTVTLALGIYGIVSVPPSIVEPLIAASIIYVCLENIYSDKLSRWRPIIVFLFGLLHGLGFAGVLTEIGLSPDNFVTGLIAFNIGVELGQLAVITACFILVGYWFRNKSWYRQRITIPASMVIALIAAYWFIERIGLIQS
jgi:hydrogenase/urease accessory protein HupE